MERIWKRTWLILAVAAAIIVLDQWTKELVRQTIPLGSYTVPIPGLGQYLVFEHVNNYGAAFGILQNRGDFFIVIAAVVSAVILYYAIRHLPPEQRFLRVLLGMQMGGALGNVIDRLARGYVTDFVKVGVPGVYYWPNFNVADSSIVSAVIGLAILILWQDLRRGRQTPSSQRASGPSEGSVEPIESPET